ncbi:Mycoplasma haemagglutinin, partial [Mycoplasmoides gallisepticum]
MSPNVNGDKRTFTIYVNAPAEGDYSIKGSYLLSGGNRNLKFSTSSTESTDNSLTINVKTQTDW